MRFSNSWLKEWVDTGLNADALGVALTAAGLELDSIDPAATAFSGVVLGEVLSVEQHPNADRLRVTQVDVGGDAPLQIVCGASNVREGMRVACATVGAKLPGDFKIKKSKLRGVESLGMLCSAVEIGMAEQADGLIEITVDGALGTDLRELLDLDDACIEVDLTPNRGDCLGIAGIARESGTLTGAAVTPVACDPVAASIDDMFPVSVSNTASCPRYLGRVIKGINPKAETPWWMAERLRRSGLRSLGPGVDVTNYVLLELGQPMHAFDLGRLSGGIEVRQAVAGEKLELLNEQTIELRDDTLVIADANGPLALAGIMGGEQSGVSDNTSNLFLECAFFEPTSLAGKARSYGLASDSSYRFERGVDFALQSQAIERATQLILDIMGGSAGPVIDVTSAENLPSREPITLRHARVNSLLGAQIDAERIDAILAGLGLQTERIDDGWRATPPSWRFDLSLEEDLIEEVARVYGYDNLPESDLRTLSAEMKVPEGEFSLSRAIDVLVDRDYQEIVTYSFVEPGLQQRLEPDHEAVALANPLSAELSHMRTGLLPGLVSAMQYNLNRQQSRVRIVESGLRFRQTADGMLQEPVIGGLVCGSLSAENWIDDQKAAKVLKRRVDFFDVKGDIEAMLSVAGGIDRFEFAAGKHPSLHPGQCASILRDGQALGWIGRLHPEIERDLDLPATFGFEITQSGLGEIPLPTFSPLSRFPSIRRDLAIVVDQNTEFSHLRQIVSEAAGERLKDLVLFDIYAGDNIEAGKKSLALGLILQDFSSTLTDEDVENITADVLTALEEKTGAALRE